MDNNLTPLQIFFDYHKDQNIKKILSECTHCYYDNEVFVCGYPTNSNYITKKSKKMLDIPDTWYVRFATGKLNRAFDRFEKLTFLCFHREEKNNKLKLINYKRMRDLYGKKEK